MLEAENAYGSEKGGIRAFVRNLFGRRGVFITVVARIPSETNTSITSMGGDIRVGDLKGRLIVSSTGGDIEVGSIEAPNILLHTSGANIIATKIITNMLEAVTNGGDINIDMIVGNSLLKTAGGDIRTKVMNGGIDASTRGGDIEVQLSNPGNSEFRTVAGDINILALSSLKANVKLQAANINVSQGFNLETTGSNIPKKYILGKLNSGGPQLSATASFGTIRLDTIMEPRK